MSRMRPASTGNKTPAYIESTGYYGEPDPLADEPGEKEQTRSETRLLVLLDETSASDRVLRYLDGIVRTGESFHIVLLQLLHHFPPELLEHGGAENPLAEERLEAELHDDQQEWMASARQSAEGNLQRAVAHLRQAGLREAIVETLCCQPEEGTGSVEFVLRLARERGCRTVVVPGDSASETPESASQKVGRELLRRHSRLSVWSIA